MKYLIGYYENWEFVVVASYSTMQLEQSVFLRAACDLTEVIRKASDNKGITMFLED